MFNVCYKTKSEPDRKKVYVKTQIQSIQVSHDTCFKNDANQTASTRQAVVQNTK